MSKLSFEYITEQATSSEGMNNKQTIQFHYFNPNGLYAAKKANDEKINKLIAMGLVPSGWSLAYGVFEHFYTDNLQKLLHKKRIRATDCYVAVKMLKEHNEKVSLKINEIINQ